MANATESKKSTGRYEIRTYVDVEKIVDVIEVADVRYWIDDAASAKNEIAALVRRGSHEVTVREIVDERTGKTEERKVGPLEIRHGIERFAEKFPCQYADLATGNSDLTVGDVLLQMIVLGEVKYG